MQEPPFQTLSWFVLSLITCHTDVVWAEARYGSMMSALP